MPVSELPFTAAPPLSLACAMCGKVMKVVAVDPTVKDVLYVYECANGHQHEVVTAAGLKRDDAQ